MKDKEKVIRVETTGKPFYFSRLYEVTPDLSTLASRLDEAMRTLFTLPLTPTTFGQIKAEVFRRSIRGTAAIEGNPLSEEGVERILDDPSKVAERAEREVANLKTAYKILEDVAQKKGIPNEFTVTEDVIKKTHYVIVEKLDEHRNPPGSYRNLKLGVAVGNKDHGGVYRPPKPLVDVKKLMRAFESWINSPDVVAGGALVRAALAHYHLGLIHPFVDGNGRVARLVEAGILTAAGLTFLPMDLSNWYYNHIDEYFAVFSQTQRDRERRVTPFIHFVIRGMYECVRSIQERAIGFLSSAAWRDYLAYLKDSRYLNQRQYDLIHILLTLPPDNTFNIHDLLVQPRFAPIFRDRATRTVGRDLGGLVKLGLIRPLDQGFYTINNDYLNWKTVGRFPGGVGLPPTLHLD